jgi:hypothetical protein
MRELARKSNIRGDGMRELARKVNKRGGWDERAR